MDLNSTYSLHITEDIIFQILIFWKCIWMAKKMPQEAVTFEIKGKELPVYKLTHAVTEFWSQVEPAKIRVIKKGGVEAGEA